MREIVFMLENMNEEKIFDFVKRQSNEQLYRLNDLLAHTNNETQSRWNKAIEKTLKF